MASRTGKLPQWWLDNTPHDTLEEQVERRRIELDEKVVKQEESDEELSNVIICGDESADDALNDMMPPIDSPNMNGTPNGDTQSEIIRKRNGYKRSTAPRSSPITPDEHESTDYKVERAKLKPVNSDNDKKTKTNEISPTNSVGSSIKIPSTDAWSNNVFSPQEAAPESAPLCSPTESSSSSNTPASDSLVSKPERHFKTAFTGVSPFDFAMQQRAREQERREKERLARESLARHHAETVEASRASEHKQKALKERLQKMEAEENIKKFKKVTLESDLATELKRRHQEEKRQKKEACEKHHEYKSTS